MTKLGGTANGWATLLGSVQLDYVRKIPSGPRQPTKCSLNQRELNGSRQTGVESVCKCAPRQAKCCCPGIFWRRRNNRTGQRPPLGTPPRATGPSKPLQALQQPPNRSREWARPKAPEG